MTSNKLLFFSLTLLILFLNCTERVRNLLQFQQQKEIKHYTSYRQEKSKIILKFLLKKEN